jgi:hypothetical protein
MGFCNAALAMSKLLGKYTGFYRKISGFAEFGRQPVHPDVKETIGVMRHIHFHHFSYTNPSHMILYDSMNVLALRCELEPRVLYCNWD